MGLQIFLLTLILFINGIAAFLNFENRKYGGAMLSAFVCGFVLCGIIFMLFNF